MSTTISNQRALKSRVSAGWPHDSKQFSFPRTHQSDLPFEREEGPGWGELAMWILAFLLVGAFMVFVLSLA
jgi:hypothetical protein